VVLDALAALERGCCRLVGSTTAAPPLRREPKPALCVSSVVMLMILVCFRRMGPGALMSCPGPHLPCSIQPFPHRHMRNAGLFVFSSHGDESGPGIKRCSMGLRAERDFGMSA